MKVIFPGSFSPPTKGHLNIIKRASLLFDTLHVAVGSDDAKAPSPFTLEERKGFLETLTKNLSNVSVSAFEGLLFPYAKELGCQVILRSVRSISDLERERILAETNFRLSGLETLFLFADPQHASISSTLIRDLALKGQSLSLFVPEEIESAIFTRLSSLRNI